ncbi:MAG: hypothetical protein ACRYFS_24125 [Janthinobacterium lividum]
MNITLDVSPELEGQLQQAALVQGTDVPTYLLDSVRLRLRPDVLTEAEASLLQVINAPLASESRSERDALLVVQAQRELTGDELETLADLIDAVEMANAKRWQALGEFAHLRGLTLPEVIKDLSPEAWPYRQFGAGRHLLAGVDVDELMAVPIEDMFADYMPGENL